MSKFLFIICNQRSHNPLNQYGNWNSPQEKITSPCFLHLRKNLYYRDNYNNILVILFLLLSLQKDSEANHDQYIVYLCVVLCAIVCNHICVNVPRIFSSEATL